MHTQLLIDRPFWGTNRTHHALGAAATLAPFSASLGDFVPPSSLTNLLRTCDCVRLEQLTILG